MAGNSINLDGEYKGKDRKMKFTFILSMGGKIFHKTIKWFSSYIERTRHRNRVLEETSRVI